MSNTVIDSISFFLSQAENSIIYFCSDDEDKQLIGFKIFQIWYYKSQLIDKVLKLDQSINLDNTFYYASILINSNNKNKEAITKAFLSMQTAIENIDEKE